jgi:uncharacterized membrane protein YbhN (UPF0104 family)
MKALSTVIALIFLAAFVYGAWLAGFWAVMYTWNWNTWAIFFLGLLIAWIARNELGG